MADRQQRRAELEQLLQENPFLTDQDLAAQLAVSVATIRMDRAALGIPELRARMKSAVKESLSVTTGELLEYEANRSAISLLVTTPAMAETNGWISAQTLYGMAYELATQVVTEPVTWCGVSNIKYKYPVHPHERLILKLKVARVRGREYYIWTKFIRDCEEVFRAKFIMKAWQEEEDEKDRD